MTPEYRFPGAASDVLPAGVDFLDVSERIFEAMLEGWRRQQVSRNLKADTIRDRLRVVQRMQGFTDSFPWLWTPQDGADFSAELASGIGSSTLRQYQSAVKLFQEYASDPRYGWVAECLKRFGRAPEQIFDEWNSTPHKDEYEGDPSRRPLSYDEVQTLFDYSESRYATIRQAKKKGALVAVRNAVFLKFVYAYGLRRREACNAALFDFHYNPKVKSYGRFGSFHVRLGKARPGGPARRRIAHTVPELDWIVDVLEQYITDVRPLFKPGNHPALFITERGEYFDRDDADEYFAEMKLGAGLDPILELHCLRHSHATHLAELDYEQHFIKEQLGHDWGSSTAIYTNVSNDYKNRKIAERLGELYGMDT